MSEDPVQLYRAEHGGLGPEDILAHIGALGLSVEFGMIMAPHRFDLVRVVKDGIDTFDGSPGGTLLAGAYEIRFFGRDTDAHWHRIGLTGKLILSTVAQIAAQPEPTIGQLDRRYRMFGKAEDCERQGWSMLRASRIRPFPVPVAATGKALVLTAIEHIAALDHGNTVVVAERLTGIETTAKGSGYDGG